MCNIDSWHNRGMYYLLFTVERGETNCSIISMFNRGRKKSRKTETQKLNIPEMILAPFTEPKGTGKPGQ